jgi:hypothetical protein
MTTNKPKGQYFMIPGIYLAVGDYVRKDGVWYKLIEQKAETCHSRHFQGVAKDGSHRHLLLDSANVNAYRLNKD